jgi:flagellar hook protein FlgE
MNDKETPIQQLHSDQRCNIDMTGSPTSMVMFDVNLNSGSTYSTLPFNPEDKTTYNYSIPMHIYDNSGNDHHLTMYFVKASWSEWDVPVIVDNKELIGTGYLKFKTDGEYWYMTGLKDLNWEPVAPAKMTINTYASTLYNTDFKIKSLSQNGRDIFHCSYK